MKNGKLFGKLNIIDLLIILILIAAVVFVGIRFLAKDEVAIAPTTPIEKIRLTFYEAQAPILLAEHADGSQLGGPVIYHDKSAPLGTLTSFETEEAFTYAQDPVTGETQKITSAIYCQVRFTSECEGYITNDGVYIDGVQYSIGSSLTIRAGQMRIACRLADFEAVG